MAVSKAAAHHRARVAALSRDRAADDPELVEARRSLRAELLMQHMRELVASAPPLTNEQVEAIAALLRAGASVSGG